MILDVAADDDADVEDLMTLEENVALPGEKPLGNSKGVQASAQNEDGAHKEKPTHPAGSHRLDNALEGNRSSFRHGSRHNMKSHSNNAKVESIPCITE